MCQKLPRDSQLEIVSALDRLQEVMDSISARSADPRVVGAAGGAFGDEEEG